MNEEYESVQRRVYDELVSRLRRDIPRIQRLPRIERQIARMAVEGRDVHEIAQRMGMAEDAVWRIVATAAGVELEALSEEGGRPFESSGLGADTDPGVTGGYGDTGFGAIGNEPGIPVPEEPVEEHERRKRGHRSPQRERGESER